MNVRYTRNASGAGKRSSVQPFWTSNAALLPVRPAQLWKPVSSLPTARASARAGSPRSASSFQVVMSELKAPPFGA